MPAPDLLGEDIVQKDKRLAYAVCGLVFLSAAMLSGCRSTASPLAEATARAGRLYDRACALLNDAAYKVGDEFAPLATVKELPEDAAGGLIELAPAGRINPKADEAIKEAIDCLTKAMESAEGQPELDKLQAKAVLARLYSLRGYRHSLEAARNGDAAWAGALKAENAAVQMSGLGRRIANCDQILSVNDVTLGELAEAAETERTVLEAKIVEAQKKIADLEKEKADLTAASEKLNESSRKLLIDSRLADPVKGVDLFDKAKTLEDQAGKNSARIAQIEESIAMLKSKTAELEAAVAATNRQTAVTGEMAKNRSERRTEVENQRTGFAAQLTETQKEAATLAGQVIEAAKAAAASEAKAAGDYEKSIKAYEDYEKTSAGFEGDASASAFLKPDPGILAMLGDTRMARGDLQVQALLLQSRLSAVVAEASKIWAALPTQNTAPAIVAQMADYVSDVAKTRENAQDDFRWAAKAYETATASQNDQNLKWAYQLQESAAYVSLYRLSADPDAKQKATAALDALGEQEGSPLIAPTAATFRKLLSDEPMTDAQAPTPPAPTPPASTPPAPTPPASAPATL